VTTYISRRPALIAAVIMLAVVAGSAWSIRHKSETIAAARPEEAQASQSRLSRYAVGIGAGSPEQAKTLGLQWMTWPPALDAVLNDSAATTLPEGVQFPIFLPIRPMMPEAMLRTIAERRPGTYYIVGNEPNLPPEFNVNATATADPDTFAQAVAQYATLFAQIDPTAKLVGPNVINWSFTCTGCGGFRAGNEWTAQMRDAYVARYGAEPPFDVWAIHLYDLDYRALPNGNADRQIAQIQELRAWLDSSPGLAGKPIWLTEVGFHWGYPGIEQREDGRFYPVGEFAYDHVERYMRALYGWLNDNAEAPNVERWFIWTNWGGVEPPLTVWGGINLMEGPAADAAIGRFGRLYRELAGLTP